MHASTVIVMIIICNIKCAFHFHCLQYIILPHISKIQMDPFCGYEFVCCVLHAPDALICCTYAVNHIIVCQLPARILLSTLTPEHAARNVRRAAQVN